MNILFNTNNDYYPIVIIPESISKYIFEDIDENLIAQEINIKKPIKKRIIRPNPPSEKEYCSSVRTSIKDINWPIILLIGFVAIVSGFGLGKTIFEGFRNSFFILIFESVMFWILGMGLFTIGEEKIIEEKIINKEKLQQLREAYKIELSRYNVNFMEAERHYKISFEKYFDEIQSNKQRIKKLIHYRNLNPVIKARRGTPSIKRGAAELKFLEYLNSEIPNLIYIDMVPVLNAQNVGITYNPDFTLICGKTGLHIDIEIDEPYTIKDKLPIHYIGCDDEKRNEFFLRNNWCIVRFSESQVIQETQECINTIKSIYQSILNLDTHFNSNLNQIARWTYEEAFIMQNNRYRENYLNN